MSFGGSESGKDDSDTNDNAVEDPLIVAEMMTTVCDAVMARRVRYGLECDDGERAKRDVSAGTCRLAGGEVCKVNRLFEDEYVTKCRPARRKSE